MTAGARNKYITFERATTASDGMGGRTVSWATLHQQWGMVMPKGGVEVERAGHMVTASTYVVRVPREVAITTQDRASWDSISVNIRAVQDPDGRGAWLDITCEEGVVAA